MKKLIALLLALVMVFALVACGGGKTNDEPKTVAFVGFGGEPFTKYAKNAREAAKELYIIATCLTNGAAGYLPTEEAFAQGGYEVSAGKFSPCLEKDLTDRVRLLLNEYQSL